MLSRLYGNNTVTKVQSIPDCQLGPRVITSEYGVCYGHPGCNLFIGHTDLSTLENLITPTLTLRAPFTTIQ